MIKIVSESKTCKECGHIHEREITEVHCDLCDTILEWDSVHGFIDFNYFSHGKDGDYNKEYHFCSWKHYFKWVIDNLPKMVNEGNFYFMNQPNINSKNYKEYFTAIANMWKEP